MGAIGWALSGWAVAAFLFVLLVVNRRDSAQVIATLIDQRNDYRDRLEALQKSMRAAVKADINRSNAPKRPQVLNSAAARAAIERSNAPYFSAEKRIPNSEVLKEQENG